jgi:preprotein translocase subunit SecE
MASDHTGVTNKPVPKHGLIEFIRETRGEISKVSWPTRKDTMVMTGLIVVMALISGLFFLAVDTGLGFVISRILGMSSA